MLSLGAQTSDNLLCSKQGMNETARELRGGRRGPHVGSSLASAGEGFVLCTVASTQVDDHRIFGMG